MDNVESAQQPLRFWCAAALMISSALGAQLVHAQTVLPEVIVSDTQEPGLSLRGSAATASRLGLPLSEVPASASVVEQPEMQRRGARSVVEAAQDTVGLTGAVRAGAPGVYQMRGFTENAISLQFDGIRIGATTVYTRPYDPFNFDRIEVLRGPGSALHGDSAVGGAINYVHRRPVKGPVGGELLLQTGRFDQHRIGVAAAGSVSEGAAFNFSVAGNRGNSAINQNSFDNYHIVGSVLFSISPSFSLLFEADHLDSSVDNAYWGTPLVNGQLDSRLRRVNYNVAPDNQYDDKVTWLRSVAEYRFTQQFSGKTSVYRYSADRNWKNFAAPRFNAAAVPQTVTIREVEDLIYDAQTSGLRQEFLLNSAIAGMPIRVNAGFDYQNNDFNSPRFQAGPTTINVDPFNPAPQVFANFTGPLNRLRASDTRNQALFAEASLDLNAAVRAHAGYRHDIIDVTTLFRQPADAVATRTERVFHANNWRAGLTYALNRSNILYLSHSSGVEPVDGSAFAFISPADLRVVDLTSARQWELGSKHMINGGRLEATTAIYDIVRKDVFTADPSNPAGARQQIGQQSSTGLELSLSWRPLPALTLGAGAAFVDAKNDRFVSGGVNVSGRTPRMVPDKVFNAFASYRLSGVWEVGGSAKYVDTVFINDDNSVKLPAWTRIDLYARHRISKSTDLMMMVKNATDRFYADWGIQFLGAQVANIAPPRSWEVMLKTRF